MRQLIIFLLFVFLSGCTACRKNDQAVMPQKYIVTEDVFLMQVDGGLYGLRLALVPESNPDRGSGYYSSPQSLDKYRLGMDEQTNNVVGIVTRNTEIEFVKSSRKKSWSFWYGGVMEDTVTFGKITSGPFFGKVADLNDVLHWSKKRIVLADEK